MASLIKESDGGWRVQFVRPGKSRGSVRIGKMSRGDAEEIRDHIAHLWECQEREKPCGKVTEKWVTSIYADPGQVWLYDRLAAAGLVTEREVVAAPKQEAKLLGPFLDAYIEGRTDLEESTLRHLRQVRDRLNEYFEARTCMEHITPGDADDWRRWLSTDAELAEICGHPGPPS